LRVDVVACVGDVGRQEVDGLEGEEKNPMSVNVFPPSSRRRIKRGS
jgi:hypothetical protein